MIPARRFFVALGVVSVMLVAASAVRPLAWMAVVMDVVLVALMVVDHRRAAATVVGFERRWPPLLVQGAPADVEVRVESEGAWAARVQVREGLHPALAARPLRRELTVAAHGSCTWSYTLRPRRRGEHQLLPLTARVLGPWGLAWAQRDALADETRRVYPQVRWEGQVGRLLVLAQRRELGQVAVGSRGEGSEPYALREYRPGDPRNTIHWKATARHGRLITREEVLERGARLVVLLDCGRAMTSSCGGRSKLDHALAAALALVRVAAARGDRVAVAAFADTVQRVVRVGVGSAGMSRAYRRLYDLEATMAEPAFDVAAELVANLEARRSTVVLMTSVVDLAAAELLRESLLRLERRHRPLLVNLTDPELQQLARGKPDTVEEAFAKVSSLHIVLENRRLARRLRRGGIRVVSAAADRLALATLDAYLSVFRGSRAQR